MGAAARKRKLDLSRQSFPEEGRPRPHRHSVQKDVRSRSPPARRSAARWLDDDDGVPPFHDMRPRPPPMPPPPARGEYHHTPRHVPPPTRPSRPAPPSRHPPPSRPAPWSRLPPEPAPAPYEVAPPVHADYTQGAYQAQLVWITLPRSAALVTDGYAARSRALVYDGTIGHMLPEAQNILTELVGDLDSADVAVDHDSDWTVFPEVAKELDKAGVGKAFCVATCAAHTRWAVGVGGKQPKHRQNCAILALAMMMLEDFDNKSVLREYPDFQTLCVQTGVLGGRSTAAPSRGLPGKPAPVVFSAFAQQPVAFSAFGQQPPPPTKKQRQQQHHHQQTQTTTAKNKHGSPEGLPALKWISVEDLPDELEGCPESAPAVGYSADVSWIVGRGHEMLSEMVGSVSEDVKIVDDPHWKVFPAIAAALKRLGFDEYSLCVAKSEKHSKWAVGVGGQWVKREKAAKLSLCVAIAQDSENSSSLFSRYPDLRKFCESNDDGSMEDALNRQASSALDEEVSQDDDVDFDGGDTAEEKVKSVRPGSGPTQLPRDVPFWLQLPEDEIIPDELEGLTPVALAVSTDGTGRKGLYTKADEVLKHALVSLGEDIGQVEYHDDVDWTKLPIVGLALKAHAEAEECFCVASLPARDVWGVGVSMKGKCRHSASKVALACALLLRIEEDDQDEFPDLESFPAFTQFFEEARQTAKPV